MDELSIVYVNNFLAIYCSSTGTDKWSIGYSEIVTAIIMLALLAKGSECQFLTLQIGFFGGQNDCFILSSFISLFSIYCCLDAAVGTIS